MTRKVHRTARQGFTSRRNYLLPKISVFSFFNTDYIDGLLHDCSISIANALEIIQSGTKPSIYDLGENFAQIHLLTGSFTCPWTSGSGIW